MITTNVVILIREKIQVKIVHLIVHNVHLIVHNVDLHSRSPRNHVQSYVFWYEHDQRGFPPNFDHGFLIDANTDTSMLHRRKWGVLKLEHNGPAVPSWK